MLKNFGRGADSLISPAARHLTGHQRIILTFIPADEFTIRFAFHAGWLRCSPWSVPRHVGAASGSSGMCGLNVPQTGWEHLEYNLCLVQWSPLYWNVIPSNYPLSAARDTRRGIWFIWYVWTEHAIDGNIWNIMRLHVLYSGLRFIRSWFLQIIQLQCTGGSCFIQQTIPSNIL